MAEAHKLSKTYRQGAKRRRIFASVLSWLVGLTLTAKAQEPTYSANSLIAAFEKGPRISLKGTEIVIRDVVAETRTSKVIFKSSQSDRVICDLGPAAQHEKPAAIGSEITVKGKVRGRGLLGNVTLDDCTIGAVDEPAATYETVPEEVATADPEIISEAGETEAPASVPDPPRAISKQPATIPAMPHATVNPRPVEPAPSVATVTDDPENSSNSSPDSQRPISYGFYALLFLSGAIASLILSKLLTPSMRVSRPPVHENTAEVRQAALQALLHKAEKKKWSGD